MKTKIIYIIAQCFLALGNVLHKLGDIILDISFKLHMKYNTKVGLYLKELQKTVYTKVASALNEVKDKKVEEEGENGPDPDNPGISPANKSGQGAFDNLSRAESAVILAGIAESYRQIGEPVSALSHSRQALRLELDAGRRKAIIASIAELRREIARQTTNTQRAPQIHETLDQNHPVRPRRQASAERKEP